MFLIFGVQGVKKKLNDLPILDHQCPNCGSGDLIPTSSRNWFTLFFIPIFPVSRGILIYQCNQCKNSFAKEIKNHLTSSANQTKDRLDSSLFYARAHIACLTHLVIEGKRQVSKELYEIDKIIYQYGDFTEELKSLKSSIEQYGNLENQVFEYLYEAKDHVKKSELWELFLSIGSFLVEFGKLTAKQESLLKDYIIASGFPKSKFDEIF